MNRALFRILAVALLVTTGASASPGGGPVYDKQGHLLFPADYREWVYLSAGMDMSYTADTPAPGHHMFNNTFVPRAAYEAFKRTGAWPDKTVIMLEHRGAATNLSILTHGFVQTTDLMGTEAHVKDIKRFKGGWGFFAFDGTKPAEQLPYQADCYSCHLAHGAVDTTFVQFYPTLLPVATAHKTLSASYTAETAKPK